MKVGFCGLVYFRFEWKLKNRLKRKGKNMGKHVGCTL